MAQRTMQAMPPAHPHGTPGAARAAIATELSVRRHDALERQRGCPGIRSDRSVGGASCWSTVTQVRLCMCTVLAFSLICLVRARDIGYLSFLP